MCTVLAYILPTCRNGTFVITAITVLLMHKFHCHTGNGLLNNVRQCLNVRQADTLHEVLT